MLYWLPAIVLSPVLALQGAWVVRTALRLPEAEGPRAGEAGQGDPLRLLVIGDSSACGVGVPRMEQALPGAVVRRFARSHHVRWKVLARNGATTRAARQMLHDAPAEPFDIAVIALGINDMKNGVPLPRWRRQYRALVQDLRDRHGVARVHVSGMPPVHRLPLLPQPLRWTLGLRARRFDVWMRRLAAELPWVTYVPLDFPLDEGAMAADGFHPGPQLYEIWAERIAQGHQRHVAPNAPQAG